MNSFNVDALSHWWNLNMSDSKKPYWVLHRSAGGRPGPTIANYGNEDPNASWTALVETINNAISQGVYEFWVVGRPGGINDTKGKVEYQLRATGWNAGSAPQMGGIYGMNPYQQPAVPAVDVAAITQQITDKLKAEHQLELMKLRHDAQMEKMEEMIAGIAEAKKSNFDRFLEVLENPDVAKGFIGLVQHLKTTLIPAPAMAANIGNVPGAKAARPAPKVYEMPAEPDTEGETDDDESEEVEIIPGLENEYANAAMAVNVLHSAGWENPGELLLKVAQFAITNPSMAKGLLTNLG